ncbi:MAG: DUF488 domain-containing protein [Ornithinimicrobium sp.]|uniref:DUF488 domain-containing protein n=1 Tax=Ornithinimicrobium sp. TaxID=1977084 RepID=UPI0026E0802E|nr:DUF488 domain-containing protein [Ornithinimicrobium sp.]MDO5738796.1 DUF488 domain-containing protein [Ornithinimicrobium sp.]
MLAEPEGPALLTFGHGTLDHDGLCQLLSEAGVRRLVDVRRYPGSRTNPAAKQPALEALTAELDVSYRWDDRLGGRRHLPAAEFAQSPDTWWRVKQFQSYATWTRSPDFGAGLADLLGDIPQQRTAIMCSEAVWWRCHRRIIADVVLGAHGIPVLHLMHDGRLMTHELSEGARILPEGGLVWDGSEAP